MAGSSLVSFNKPALNPDQLLAKLEAQGVVVHDRAGALAYLSYVGGYRLKGYWFHLIDPVSRRFRVPVSFEAIIDRFEFDLGLRKITFGALARIEAACRASFSNVLSRRHGPHWFLNAHVLKPSLKFGLGGVLQSIEKGVMRGQGGKRDAGVGFLKHYVTKYSDPYLPPSWGVAESVTFGFWSRIFGILRSSEDKAEIALLLNVDHSPVFASWLHSLTHLRNTVCHHGRLLGRSLAFPPMPYKRKGLRFPQSEGNTFFVRAAVINCLLRAVPLSSRWTQELEELFHRYPTVDPKDVGFSRGWADSELWVR